AFPVCAIRYCLKAAGVQLRDLDAVAVPWKYWQVGRRGALALGAMMRSPQLFWVKGKRSAERLGQEWKELAMLGSYLRRKIDGTRGPRPIFLDHHLCHAASSFLVSPFDRAAVLIVDGASEAHTTMLARADRDGIEVMKRIALPHSLGQFYAAMTAYLGFKPDQDEYIVMGLAAYGEPRFAHVIREKIVPLLPNGEFRLTASLLDFHLARLRIFSPALLSLLGPNRDPEDEITQRHRDVAASVQRVLEDTLIHLARFIRQETGLARLCLAGGVAYNCVANSRLEREAGFQDVFVPPAAG